jgi:mannose-6-phosphate isomerase-like protein (cupin superfamily)
MKTLKISELGGGESRTVQFDGADHGTPLSFFLVDNDEGQGPMLHQHAYPETWIVQQGSARFTVGDAQVAGEAGQIIVIPAYTPHCFVNVGPGPLRMVCLHPVGRIANLAA